jgi:aspartate/methionine/tyrosine aminotransferase
MRQSIVHPGADQLSYEIREIVEVAKKIEATSLPIIWENIGDPIAKGAVVPDWIKQIVKDTVDDNASFGYSPTKGLLATREYIAKERNLEGGIQITADDILFFNGLGDAISALYSNLNPLARVIGPNPAYPTHSSAEAAHADLPHISYKLDPKNNWKPDLADMRQKIESNPAIAGILIINPDNPTGFVYPQETLKEIVALAKEFELFVISDEIYSNLFYGTDHKKLASVVGDVPGIAMRGISKEFPWPGSRCGWVEFYNRDKDENFNRYTKSLIESKMLEVCSTTLPQQVLPKVMSDSRYYPYLAERNALYEKRAELAFDILSQIPEITIHKPNGAFYMTAVFNEGVLKEGQHLAPKSPQIGEIIESTLQTPLLDKRFVYGLLGATGICVVPLSSGFNSSLYGFRFTLLEPDEKTFVGTIQTLKESIEAYIKSA